MDPDREVLREHYTGLAADIASELEAGRDVAYLTLGDPMTYSTNGYTLAALAERLPAAVNQDVRRELRVSPPPLPL